MVANRKSIIVLGLFIITIGLPASHQLTTDHWPLTTVFGQSATATLSGTILDETGAVVPDVKVTVLNVSTTLRRQATTSRDGSFTIPLLPPGRYKVTAEREGFATVQVPDVVLNVNDQRAFLIQLKAGVVSETITVTGVSTIQESAEVGTVVDRQFVANMPLNGRSLQSLIALSPGVVIAKTTRTVGQFNVNGQRTTANYITIDGVSANIGISPAANVNQGPAGALPGFTASGGTNNLVSIDALEEFKIQTSSFAPEFGRTPGGQISMVTRSGTNEFHGSLFEYFRNDALDANDWFRNALRLPRSPLRQNDFGGTTGGRIFKDKTFFFVSHESLRLLQPLTAQREVPSLAMRQSAPAALQPILNAFPLPNGPTTATGLAQFNSSFSDPSNTDATSFRIDHNIGKKLVIFGRYNISPSEIAQRRSGMNTISVTKQDTQTLTGRATYIFSPMVTNEFTANYSRFRATFYTYLDDFGGAVVPPDSALLPSFVNRDNAFVGYSLSFGITPSLLLGLVNNNFQRQINLIDSVSVLAGPHQLKFGVDYRRLFPIRTPSSAAFQFSFANAAAVTNATVSTFAVVASAESRPIFDEISFFAQDTWKPTRRLTLTYGFRWDINPAPSEASGNLPLNAIGLDNPATATIAPRGTKAYKTTYGNFAPRLGLSFLLRDKAGRETVLRGGIGIFYDTGNGQAAFGIGAFVPFQNFRSLSNTPFPLSAANLQPPALDPGPPYPELVGIDPNLKLPYTAQLNLAVEQSLGSNQTFSATYVGAFGRRLIRTLRLPTPTNLNARLIYAIRNESFSDYHAMQLQFQRRLSRGLQVLSAYTWSHSIDDASDDVVFPSPVRASSDFDIRHVFSTAVSYNLPTPNLGRGAALILKNWGIDLIARAQSATSFDLVARSLINAGGIVQNIRPNLIPGIPIWVDNPSAPGGRVINSTAPSAAQVAAAGCVASAPSTPAKGAFCTPPLGTQGSLGRNVLRGFPMRQLDFSWRRQFTLTERFNLLFRGDLFNIFNHPNFADPIGALTSGSFGRSTTMLANGLGTGGVTGGLSPIYQIGGPRSVQLSLKLQF